MAKHIEDDECKRLWQWAQYIPELRDYLYHVPNGGKRNAREAGRMKAMGVRAGVHDYHLPVPRGEYNGLWCEMKAPKPHKSSVSKPQHEWYDKMVFTGHAVFICYGWLQAKRAIEWYLKLPVPGFNFPTTPTIEELMNAA